MPNRSIGLMPAHCLADIESQRCHTCGDIHDGDGNCPACVNSFRQKQIRLQSETRRIDELVDAALAYRNALNECANGVISHAAALVKMRATDLRIRELVK